MEPSAMDRRQTYNYKQPLQRVGTDNDNFGPGRGVDQHYYKSPSNKAMYYLNEASMEEIEMTDAGDQPDMQSFS